MSKDKGRRWSGEDKVRLGYLVQHHTPVQIAQILGRSAPAVRKMMKQLGLAVQVKTYNLPYSQEELQILKMLGPASTLQTLTQYLPGRTKDALRHQCHVLRIRPRYGHRHARWTPQQEATLRRLAPHHTVEQICDLMDKSEASIRKKCSRLGIRFPAAQRPWSQQDDQKLREMVRTHSVQEVQEALGRTRAAVFKRAGKLGLHWDLGRWGLNRVAELLGVSGNTALKYRDRLGQQWAGRKGAEEASRQQVQDIAAAILRQDDTQVNSKRSWLNLVASGAWDRIMQVERRGGQKAEAFLLPGPSCRWHVYWCRTAAQTAEQECLGIEVLNLENDVVREILTLLEAQEWLDMAAEDRWDQYCRALPSGKALAPFLWGWSIGPAERMELERAVSRWVRTVRSVYWIEDAPPSRRQHEER